MFLTLQIDGGIHVDLGLHRFTPRGPPPFAHQLGFRLLFRVGGYLRLGDPLVGSGEVRQEARQIGLRRKGAHQLFEERARSVLAV